MHQKNKKVPSKMLAGAKIKDFIFTYVRGVFFISAAIVDGIRIVDK